MKPSLYPVLHNRPIDQWKVIELREELKRRKLTTKGLKEDLVKRLDEALRSEMETANEEEVVDGNGDDSLPEGQDNADEATPLANESVIEAEELDQGADKAPKDGGNQDDSQPKGQDNADEATPIAIESVHEANEVEQSKAPKDAENQADGSNIAVGDGFSQVADDDSVKIPVENLVQQVGESTPASPATKEESVSDTQTVETSKAATENTSSEAALVVQGSENEQSGMENWDSRAQPAAEDVKPVPGEEVKHVMSDINIQVSEGSPSLGFPVKNDSISADSMSIDEKNELKDNTIADNVILEPDVKHEMVQPSSSPAAPEGGKSQPLDVEEPQNKVSFDETNNTVTDMDMSKKNSSTDLGSPEKLNLDRSSGDDSMEDILESKQVDSTYNSDEVVGRNEKSDVTMVKEGSPVDVVGDDISAIKKDDHVENLVAVVGPTEKRKLPDEEALSNNELSKRQRRWKTENIKVSEPQASGPPLSTTPREMSEASDLKRGFSRSNSNAGSDTPKERVVPPPLKPPTDSLRIDYFLRPFTLKAVQELLGKTGTVTSFWMDHIKTHCYVTYSSVEEAIETRNALYNLQWPPNGGRLLAAEFVDAQEVKSRVEGASQPPAVAPAKASPAPSVALAAVAPAKASPAPSVAPLQPSPRQLGPRQKQPPQTNLPPPPPLTNPPPARERLQPPPPPPAEDDPPVLTLDDLFKKTKATPRIYYLPLSEEQVRAKLGAQSRNPKAVV